MKELQWELTESATRGTLLTQTMAKLSDAQQEAVRHYAGAAGVPHVHHHNIAEVKKTIASLNAQDAVKEHLSQIYDILAEAEASAHGCAVEETHFHEVGDGLRIENTLMLCMAIDALAPETITATKVQTGEGKVQCAHGELDIPAPATAAIIARGIPVCEKKLPGELLTPTSAAIILHFVNAFDD